MDNNQLNSASILIKNIKVLPTDWQNKNDEYFIEQKMCVQYTYRSSDQNEYVLLIYPPGNFNISDQKKEILNIIQMLPYKIKAGFNPLIEEYHNFKGLYLDYKIETTPESNSYKNGSIRILLQNTNPSEYVYVLNNVYSSSPTFTHLENGKYDLSLIHVPTNQSISTSIHLIAADSSSLSSNLNVVDAFRIAFPHTNGSKEFKAAFKLMLNRGIEGLVYLKLHHKRIKDLTKSDLKLLFDHLDLKPHFHNKFRSNYVLLFKVLIYFEVVDINLAFFLPQKRVTHKIKRIIPDHILNQILDYLFKCNYPFYRYVKIFYHSGARTSELFNLKAKDVDLEAREYKIVIKKGNSSSEAIKAILPDVYDLWVEVMKETSSLSDYLFSVYYLPGPVKANPNVNSNVWHLYVYKKMKLNYSFYSLKHKFLDLIDQYQDKMLKNTNLATVHASHSNKSITETHYLVGKNKRQIEALKSFSLEEYMNEN